MIGLDLLLVVCLVGAAAVFGYSARSMSPAAQVISYAFTFMTLLAALRLFTLTMGLA